MVVPKRVRAAKQLGDVARWTGLYWQLWDVADVSSSADTIAFCWTAPNLASAPCWKNRAPTPVPRPLRDPALQDAIFAAWDRMVGVG